MHMLAPPRFWERPRFSQNRIRGDARITIAWLFSDYWGLRSRYLSASSASPQASARPPLFLMASSLPAPHGPRLLRPRRTRRLRLRIEQCSAYLVWFRPPPVPAPYFFWWSMIFITLTIIASALSGMCYNVPGPSLMTITFSRSLLLPARTCLFSWYFADIATYWINDIITITITFTTFITLNISICRWPAYTSIWPVWDIIATAWQSTMRYLKAQHITPWDISAISLKKTRPISELKAPRRQIRGRQCRADDWCLMPAHLGTTLAYCLSTAACPGIMAAAYRSEQRLPLFRLPYKHFDEKTEMRWDWRLYWFRQH